MRGGQGDRLARPGLRLGGLVLLAVGIVALLPRASWLALGATIVGGVLVGALLLYLTSSVAHRPPTTELPLIVVWATGQLAAGVTLRTAGVLGAPAASAWIVATAIATLVGLACYLIFYRLDPIPAYWIGMVPLAVDGVVAALAGAGFADVVTHPDLAGRPRATTARRAPAPSGPPP